MSEQTIYSKAAGMLRQVLRKSAPTPPVDAEPTPPVDPVPADPAGTTN